jgi:PAS domain S-box-containing protein
MAGRLVQLLKNKPLITALLVVIMLTVVIMVGSAMVIYRYIAVNKSIQRSLDYNLRLEELISQIKDTEANQREYLLTGNDLYYSGYAKSVSDVTKAQKPLERLLSRTERQVISQQTAARMSVLARIVNEQRNGNSAAAIEVVKGGEGKVLMERLTDHIASLERQKARQIEQERLAAEQLSDLVLIGIATATIVSILLIGFAARLALEAERNERDLRRSQAELQSIMDYAPNYIQMLDTNLKRVFINRAAYEQTKEPLIGRIFGDFMEPDERKRVHRVLRNVLKTGRPADLEFTTHLARGQQWFKNSVGPIYKDGRIAGLVLSTFDVSDEREARLHLEEQTKTAEAAKIQAQALLRSIGEGLLVIDEHGVIVNANPPAALALGYDVKTLLGKWFPGTVLALDVQGNAIPPLQRPATQALMSGRAISDTLWYQRKDKSVFPAAVTVSPVVVDGRPTGAIEVFRDLTNEHKLEQAKEEFVSLASHQLRTPATGAKAFLSLLLDGYGGKLTNRQEEYLQKINKANDRQLEIINDLLNVARIDSGRIMPEMVSSDIIGILNEVIEEQRPLVDGREQSIRLEAPKKRSSVLCDPKLMHMALENIINNASKYTYKGGSITISVRFPKHQIHIRVQDTGVGIAPADQSRIFQRFGRVHNPLSVTRGGTGLGLYLTRNIIDMHQGRIHLESVPGGGTTFDIELPLQPLTASDAFEINKKVTTGRDS